MPTPTADTYLAASGTTLQGGRGTPPSGLPTWVPTTAWQWTDVPGTNWIAQVKSDGTGSSGALSVSADPGGVPYGDAMWGTFNGPCYSANRHEIYVFGGGHAQSTNNILTKYMLGSNAPSVTVACPASTASLRNAEFYAGSSYPTADLHWSDGKPYSPHSYRNLFYLDAQDLFICCPLTAAASPGESGVPGSGVTGPTTGGGPNTAAFSRASGAWQSSTYFQTFPSGPEALPRADAGPRFLARDGSAIYYWRSGFGLCKLDAATRLHTTIGGHILGNDGQYYYSRQADDGTGRVLTVGGNVSGAAETSAWNARFIDLTTGAAGSFLTVSGASLPSALVIVDMVYVPSRDYYVSLWVDGAAWGQTTGSIATIVVATLAVTSPSTAVATIRGMSGSGPVRCGAYKGMFYDPTYDCLLFALNNNESVKAVKLG